MRKFLFLFAITILMFSTNVYAENVQVVTEKMFEEAVLKSDKPVLVDFYAVWCPPCKMLGPIVEEVAGEMQEQLKVVKIDVNENQALAIHCGVKLIPMLILVKNGQPVSAHVGFISKDDLKAWLNQNLVQ